MLRARVDRHRCLGVGNCITLAPTAFNWHPGDLFKVDVVDLDSVDEEVLRAAALSCPTNAIELEQVDDLLPWALRHQTGRTRRVLKTFMFTDIVRSTNLAEALGDDAWTRLLRWHDEALRALFAAYDGHEVSQTGDGFLVVFDSPDAAVGCAVAIQRRLDEHRSRNGFAPEVRIGLHASEAAEVGDGNYQGIGVHEAARIGALADAGHILASADTISSPSSFTVGAPRAVELRGISTPVEVVDVDWH